MKFVIKILLLLVILNLIAPAPAAAQGPPVLAFYYAWYDQNTWTSGQSVDLPAVRYNSADPATIERHVAEARGAGIDALIQSWYGPQVENNQTETNFRILLDKAQAQGLQAAVHFETTSPFLGDAGAVSGALSTLLATHAQHPAYLRYQGKPVIFFWRQQRFSVEQWQAMRTQIDPGRGSYWVAEGVDISYQAVFDGHHLYSIAWAGSPAAELAKWSGRVRAFETENGVDRLWVATAMPGYNDTRLPRSNAFAVGRRGGDYYRETWQGAVASQPDMIIITSFNEWPEGTHLEPSESYGNLYLDITRELVTGLRGNPPPAPLPAPPAPEQPVEPAAPAERAAAQQQPPPDGPYIQIDSITNVRQGPGTDTEIVERLPAGAQVAVIGRLESSEWWQIESASSPAGVGWVSAEVVDFVGDEAAVPLVEAPPAAEPPAEADTAEAETEVPAEDATTQAEAQVEAEEAAGSGEAAAAGAEAEAAAPEEPAVTIPDGGVNLRAGPGLDSELLGRLEAGSRHAVVGQDATGDWWQIEADAAAQGTAWVAKAVVDFSGDDEAVPVNETLAPVEEAEIPVAETPAPPPAEPVIAGAVEALDAINVRAEPALDGAVVGALYLGESAPVLAVSQDGDWWQIELAGAPEQTAWVAAEFVEFTGDPASVPISGLGTPTPTAAPTNTPQATATPAAAAILIPAEQPTLAPTATSIYQATSAAMLATPNPADPALEPANTAQAESDAAFGWADIPWGIVSILLVLGFVGYQFFLGRSKRRGV